MIILFFLACNFILNSQNSFTASNFESAIFDYQVIQKEGISEKDFERGAFIFNEARNAVAESDMLFNCADYWNITMAFIKLGEPKAHIELAFKKAINDSPESICAYIKSFGKQSVKKLEENIPELFATFYPKCETFKEATDADKKQIPEIENSLNQLIRDIGNNDQEYRNSKPIDWSKQTPIDKRNLFLIDSLYAAHETYIGKDLVGEKQSHIMWIIIQHSNLEKMEFYLPIIHKAVKENQLHKTPLKMLLDRIHCIKYNYQFFGSQFGGDCETKEGKMKEEIMEKYNLY